VTINGAVSDLDPVMALTICGPVSGSSTLKVALKTPLLSVLSGEGVVVTGVSSKVMITSDTGSKLIPMTLTGVPKGPEVVLSPMVGGVVGGEDVTVNVAESEEDPSVAVTISDPGTVLSTVKSASKFPLLSVGVICCWISPKFIITLEFGAKLVPETVTVVLKGPEFGLS
jgi:hypothetical protein